MKSLSLAIRKLRFPEDSDIDELLCKMDQLADAYAKMKSTHRKQIYQTVAEAYAYGLECYDNHELLERLATTKYCKDLRQSKYHNPFRIVLINQYRSNGKAAAEKAGRYGYVLESFRKRGIKPERIVRLFRKKGLQKRFDELRGAGKNIGNPKPVDDHDQIHADVAPERSKVSAVDLHQEPVHESQTPSTEQYHPNDDLILRGPERLRRKIMEARGVVNAKIQAKRLDTGWVELTIRRIVEVE